MWWLLSLMLLPLAAETDDLVPVLKSHVKFLADDLLEGRETSFRGQKIAALYLASQFGRAGVEPFGSDYFQSFELRVTEIDPDESWIRSAGHGSRTEIRFPLGFYAHSRHFRDLKRFGTLAFAGYGIQAPEYGYDDYAELDVREKWVVVVAGSPPKLNEGEHGYPSGVSYKMSWAKREGAIGLIVLPHPERAAGLLPVGVPASKRMAFKDESVLNRDLVPVFYLQRHEIPSVLGQYYSDFVARLKRIDGLNRPDSTLYPRRRTEIQIKMRTQSRIAENVVALIPGSDPSVADEHVVVSAHFDHLGVMGGFIYNGADDNGTGSAVLLALADRLPAKRPRRSILLVGFSGEEEGLLGSRHFIEEPIVALDRIVCDINIDMIGRNRPGEIGLIPSSRDQSTLLETLNDVNLTQSHQFKFISDMDEFHTRSDHYNFVKEGIPAVFFFSGIHGDYHGIDDDWDRIDYDKLARVHLLIEDFVIAVADKDERPKFITGSP